MFRKFKNSASHWDELKNGFWMKFQNHLFYLFLIWYHNLEKTKIKILRNQKSNCTGLNVLMYDKFVILILYKL